MTTTKQQTTEFEKQLNPHLERLDFEKDIILDKIKIKKRK